MRFQVLCLDKTETTLQDLFKTQSHKQFLKILSPPHTRSRLDCVTPTSPPQSPLHAHGATSPTPQQEPSAGGVPNEPETQSWPPRKVRSVPSCVRSRP